MSHDDVLFGYRLRLLTLAEELEVAVAATFPLEEAAEAFAAATGGGAGGAVVLRP